jgi:hypothetical protein
MPKTAFVALAVIVMAAVPLEEAPSVKKMTPILFVEAIEPCLPFWTDWLGFEVTVTVPRDDRLDFAILQRGPIELMYQTRQSVADDVPALLDDVSHGATTLFIEVESLEPYLQTLTADVLVPRRQTFYGMDEVFVRAPCGSIVGLAASVEG